MEKEFLTYNQSLAAKELFNLFLEHKNKQQ